VHQITMRAVDFQSVDAQAAGTPGRIGKRLAYATHAIGLERTRQGLSGLVRQPRRRIRHPAAVRHRDHFPTFPRHAARRLSSSVCQLQHDGILGASSYRFDRGRQRTLREVIPQPQVARCDAALWLDRRSLHKQQGRPGRGEAAEMNNVPLGRPAGFGNVLAHR
jgi:hypothetical protein